MGRNTRIGANAVVVNDIPAGMVVVGIPGKPVQREGPAPSTHRPDLAHNVMPDLIAAHLERILGRLDDVEAAIRANGNGPDSHYSKAPNLRAPDPDYVI